jgi:hypothetical protein
MRILDKRNDVALTDVILLLTQNEASELKETIELMLKNIDFNRHEHINDKEYEHEIILSIYDESNPMPFNKRIQKLITEDK